MTTKDNKNKLENVPFAKPLMASKVEDSSTSPDKTSSEKSFEGKQTTSSEARCRRCGAELLAKDSKCLQCSYVPGNTGGFKSPVINAPKQKPPRNLLPKFLRESPLAKIKVPASVNVAVIVVLPAIGLLLFLVSSGQLCINCAKVTGSYTTDIKLDESSLSINVVLKQDQGNIVGQVVVSEQKPPTPSNASRQYLEVIHTGKIRQRTVAFKTYPRSGQTPRFEFTGEAVGEHELKGNLVVNMPEIGCVGRFPVDLK